MKLTSIPTYIITTVTVVIILGLWTTGSMSLLDPRDWGWLSLCGYAFPAFLIATMGILVLWVVIRRWKLVIITVVGLVVAYMPVTLYCPMHHETEVPDDAIQVMTYNTENWGHGYKGEPDKEKVHRQMLQYIDDCHPDIVCIQEGTLNGEVKVVIDSLIKPHMPYIDSVQCNNEQHAVLVLFSRFPIIRKEEIHYETKGNGTAAFWLSVHGKEVIVINNHLQTMGFSMSDKEKFSEMMHGDQKRDSMKQTSHTIFGKIYDASCTRAPQADAVARFIRMHKGTPIIVCGDFNDPPLSYTHRTIAHGLTDCYEATAMGPGFSFSHYGMRVRIDNIMCSDAFQPYNCFTDNASDYSDHYPMRCWFTFK